MNRESSQSLGYQEEIQLLTFTVRGVKLGVDTDQIAEVMEVEAAERLGAEVLLFHERVSFGAGALTYDSPKAIMIKDQDKPFGVIISNPDDIISMKVRSIRPMPSLIAMNKSTRLFWGAIPSDESIMLLVDLSRIRHNR